MLDLETLLGSATAGLFARLICHPFDTCKAQLQTTLRRNNIISTIRTCLKDDGIRGLYKGIGAAVVGGMPAVCLYLSSYEVSVFLFVLAYFIKRFQ